MSYELKRAKYKQSSKKISTFGLCIKELKSTVPVTAKRPGKVSKLVLKNIYIAKLYGLIYLA